MVHEEVDVYEYTCPQNVVVRSSDLGVGTEESKLDLEALVEHQRAKNTYPS